MDMNQKEQGEGGGAYQPAVVQKPDSQSLSILYQNPSLDSTKRRRLYENSSSRSDIFETKLVKVIKQKKRCIFTIGQKS